MKRYVAIITLALATLAWGYGSAWAAPAASPDGAKPPAEGAMPPAGTSEAPPSTGAGDPSAPPGDDGSKPPTADGTKPPKDGGELPGAGGNDPPGPKAWPKIMYGLGISGMYNLVPNFFLKAFTEAAYKKGYGVYQPAFGIHFVRRKALMDMTVRVMFGFYDIHDGNWLGSGHGFDETDYTEFHDMNFLWADITWTWHTRLAKHFYLAYGVGIGIGWVSGKVYTTPSGGCSKENYSDARLCRPSLPAQCDKDGCTRTSLAGHPDREREKSVPPVLPAVNGLIGLRWDIFRHLTMRFDTGIFLPGLFYVQLGVTAMF